MKTEALGTTVLRVELLHTLLVISAWAAFLPTRLIEPRALFGGAIFMGVNFLLLSCGIRWVLTPFAGKGRVRTGVTLLVLKLLLFLGLVSLLLFRIELDPLSFALGFSSLLVAIVVDRLLARSWLGE